MMTLEVFQPLSQDINISFCGDSSRHGSDISYWQINVNFLVIEQIS